MEIGRSPDSTGPGMTGDTVTPPDLDRFTGIRVELSHQYVHAAFTPFFDSEISDTMPHRQYTPGEST